MVQLRRSHSEFDKHETVVVVVGPESADAFAKHWRDKRLPFVGLPDPGHRILKLYGQEINLFKLGRMPAQVLIDKQGVARFAHYGHNMSDIPCVEDTLKTIESISV